MFAMDYQFLRDIGGSSLELFFCPFPLHTRKINGRIDGQHNQDCCCWCNQYTSKVAFSKTLQLYLLKLLLHLQRMLEDFFVPVP